MALGTIRVRSTQWGALLWALAAVAFGTVAEAQMASVKTVFLIVLSTQPWGLIQGSASAPYINGTLLPMASYATNYSSPAGALTAQAEYFWLEAGSSFGVLPVGGIQSGRQSTSAHLVSLLNLAGVSWKSYQEDIDGSQCPLQSKALYLTVYNPFVYFDDVTDHFNPYSPFCIAHVRPYGELATDLTSNSVARYNFIRPNLCHAMARGCPTAGDRVKAGDAWLAAEVPKILTSAAFLNGGVLLITWDHAGDASADQRIGLLVISPFAKKGYANAIRYTHGSTLRTLQEMLGVSSTLLGDAAVEQDLSDFFETSTLGQSALSISWAASPGATGYGVRRVLASSGPYVTVAAGLSETHYTDRSVAGGNTYFYVVTATNAAGESVASAPASGAAIAAPAAPTQVVVTQAPP